MSVSSMSILIYLFLINGFHKVIDATTDVRYLTATSDNGFLVGDAQVLIKIDNNANVQWAKGMLTSYPIYSSYIDVIQRASGNYLSVGDIWYSSSQKGDAGIFEFDQNGNLVWANSYDADSIEGLYGVTEVFGGNLVSVGAFMNQTGLYAGFVLKTDGGGGFMWARNFYFTTGESILWYVMDLPNNDLVILGETSVNGNWDLWFFKIDKDGNSPVGYFSNIYGSNNADEYARGFVRTSDGGYLILADVDDGNNTNPVLLIKTDSSGNVQWSKKYIGDAYPNDVAYGVTETGDGNFLISGTTIDLNNYYKVGFLFKVDINGNVLWSKTYGDPNDFYDNEFYIRPQEDSSGNILVAGMHTGSPQSGMYVVKANQNGETGCLNLESSYNFSVSSYQLNTTSGLQIGYPNVNVNAVGGDNSVSASTITICQGTFVKENFDNKKGKSDLYYIENNLIIFKRPLNFKIYRENGRIFKSGFKKSVRLERGIYFLKIGEKGYKVIIK